MALDARLASPVLLALAARRARERQVTQPRRHIVLQVVYVDALGLEPDELGECYTYELPAPRPGDLPW